MIMVMMMIFVTIINFVPTIITIIVLLIIGVSKADHGPRAGTRNVQGWGLGFRV